MPSIEKNFPTAFNLEGIDHALDLVRDNKFPCLEDENLHLIMGIREANLINYDKVRTPINPEQPFLAHCKIGWTAYGPDIGLNNKQLTHCNLVRCSDEMIEKKLILCCTSRLLSVHMILTVRRLLMIKLY
jgi:hypothetical protein